MSRTVYFLSEDKFKEIKSNYSRFNEPWIEEEVEELKSMFRENVPLDQMSTQLQRTPKAIRMKLKSLGLVLPSTGPRRWTEEDDAELMNMFLAGFPVEELATRFDRTPRAITSRLIKTNAVATFCSQL